MKNTTMAAIVLSVVLAVVVLILGGSYMSFKHEERMAELGYEKVCYPGSVCSRWTKVPTGRTKEGK